MFATDKHTSARHFESREGPRDEVVTCVEMCASY